MDSGHWLDVQSAVDRLLDREPIKDPGYRGMIFASELGHLLRAYTHDPTVNPTARRVGSKDDELSAAGDTLIQLLIYLRSRGLSIDAAYHDGLGRMEEQIWRDRPKSIESTSRMVVPAGALAVGKTAAEGEARASLVVVRNGWSAAKVANELRSATREAPAIVALEDYPDQVWQAVRQRFDRVAGVLLRNGGVTSHPANVCSDDDKPCIVGIIGYEALTSGILVEMIAPTMNEQGIVRSVSEPGKSRKLDAFP